MSNRKNDYRYENDDDHMDDDDHDNGVENSQAQTQGYVFEFDAGGSVVGVSEVEHGVLQLEGIDWDETYALQADGTVVKTELDDGGSETTVYADTNDDGLFERISETWTAMDGSTVQILRYSGTAGDDMIAVRGGNNAAGGVGSDNFVICEAAHLRIEDFDNREGDHLVFDTDYGLTKQTLEQYVTGLELSGLDLIVHFGADVSITLVGMATNPTLSWDDVTVVS